MPDFDAFWGGRGKANDMRDDHNRAGDILTMILDNPTSVTLIRGATKLAAQTVLATQGGGSVTSDAIGPAGMPGVDDIMLLGVCDHDTVADFNVQRGDTFRLWNTNWTVKFVVRHVPGVIEAHCEGQQ